MPHSRELVVWLARAAVALYVAAYLYRSRARALWTSGFAVYLVHVACAFQFVYGWSHESALRETARQTRELFGVDTASGLYLNYLFTLVWFVDCVLWPSYRGRAVARAFLAFMVVNASVVVWAIRSFR